MLNIRKSPLIGKGAVNIVSLDQAETVCDIGKKISIINNSQPNTSTNSSPARGFSLSNGSSSSIGCESSTLLNHHNNDTLQNTMDQNTTSTTTQSITFDVNLINKTFPWIRKEYEPTLQGLNDELNDLCNYLKPTNNERLVRYKIFNEVRSVLQATFEHCEVLPYGSMASELFLPSSDIDIVCFMKHYVPDHLNIAAEAFTNSIHLEVIKKIEGATVPIIKLRNNSTQSMIDVSFDTQNVLPTVDFLLRFKQRNPKLTPLVLILKQLLQDHNLNTNTDGGLSSYAIVLLVIRLLQIFPKNDYCNDNLINDQDTLAHYFLKFIEYYGVSFDYEKNAIRVRDDGAILTKQEMFREMNSMDSLNHSLLVIEDPIMPHKDVCKNSYRFAAIKNLWKSMFMTFNEIFENGFQNNDNYFGVSKSFFVKFIHLRRCSPEIRSIIEKANVNFQGEIGPFPILYPNGQIYSFQYNQIYPPPFGLVNQCVPGMQLPYNSYTIPVGYLPIPMYNSPPNGVSFPHQLPLPNGGTPHLYPTHFVMPQQIYPGTVIYATNYNNSCYYNNQNNFQTSNPQGQSTVTSEIEEASEDKDSFSNSESEEGKD
uniref:PAP-associated domain-containing protein n=1 Tax=Strongyloides stercoralis TaxID=6248 RepID=A0A0K0DXA0_STRER